MASRYVWSPGDLVVIPGEQGPEDSSTNEPDDAQPSPATPGA